MVKKQETIRKDIGDIKRAATKERYYTICGEIVAVSVLDFSW